MIILLIEEDPILLHHLSVQFRELGHRVKTARTAKEGLHQALNYPIDVAIIDLSLPDEDGLSLLYKIRTQDVKFPILVLTSRMHLHDKLDAFNAGADDYVIKPCKVKELSARLNALFRRSAGVATSVIIYSDIEINLLNCKVTINKETIKSTPLEYLLFEYLIRHADQVVNKQKLLDIVYDDGEGDPNTIEVTISRMRKKIINAGIKNPIVTIRGQGYIFAL